MTDSGKDKPLSAAGLPTPSRKDPRNAARSGSEKKVMGFAKRKEGEYAQSERARLSFGLCLNETDRSRAVSGPSCASLTAGIKGRAG